MNDAKSLKVVVRARWTHAHRLLVVAYLLLAIATLWSLIFDASIAALLISVLATLLLLDAFVTLGRWRAADTRPLGAVRRDLQGRDLQERDLHEQDTANARRRTGISAAVRIFVLVLLAGLLAATLSLETKFIAVGALVATLGFALFGGPAWLAAIGDEEEFRNSGE